MLSVIEAFLLKSDFSLMSQMLISPFDVVYMKSDDWLNRLKTALEIKYGICCFLPWLLRLIRL